MQILAISILWGTVFICIVIHLSGYKLAGFFSNEIEQASVVMEFEGLSRKLRGNSSVLTTVCYLVKYWTCHSRASKIRENRAKNTCVDLKRACIPLPGIWSELENLFYNHLKGGWSQGELGSFCQAITARMRGCWFLSCDRGDLGWTVGGISSH